MGIFYSHVQFVVRFASPTLLLLLLLFGFCVYACGQCAGTINEWQNIIIHTDNVEWRKTDSVEDETMDGMKPNSELTTTTFRYHFFAVACLDLSLCLSVSFFSLSLSLQFSDNLISDEKHVIVQSTKI